ncbi:hypothetical protein PC116_g14851 [Phytophthora cactorum]|nr:hypothetical protein PC120_g23347 [Phytophthora cactorum]KAG4237097.1 hypothetical protein PC116_g14851 [Phytophthora cactorum]
MSALPTQELLSIHLSWFLKTSSQILTMKMRRRHAFFVVYDVRLRRLFLLFRKKLMPMSVCLPKRR